MQTAADALGGQRRAHRQRLVQGEVGRRTWFFMTTFSLCLRIRFIVGLPLKVTVRIYLDLRVIQRRTICHALLEAAFPSSEDIWGSLLSGTSHNMNHFRRVHSMQPRNP